MTEAAPQYDASVLDAFADPGIAMLEYLNEAAQELADLQAASQAVPLIVAYARGAAAIHAAELLNEAARRHTVMVASEVVPLLRRLAKAAETIATHRDQAGQRQPCTARSQGGCS